MSSDSWSDRLLGGFRKTSERLAGSLTGFGGATRLTEAQLDEIEDALIMADLGPRAAARIRDRLSSARFDEGLDDKALREAVASEIAAILRPVAKPLDIVAFPRPQVILVIRAGMARKCVRIGWSPVFDLVGCETRPRQTGSPLSRAAWSSRPRPRHPLCQVHGAAASALARR